MPYDRTFNLLSFGGPIGQTPRLDDWSVGIKFAPGGTPSAGDYPPTDPTEFPLQLKSDIVTAVRGLWTSSAAKMRSDAVLEWIKFNRIQPDGKYASAINTIQWDVERTPGATAAAYPQVIACATTYRTEARRGAGSRGRSFWPTALPFDAASGGLTAESRAALAGAVSGMLYSVGQACFAAGFPLRAVVMSNIGSGTTRSINRVEVGSRFDVQRRRDNAEAETYTGIGLNLPTG